MGVASNDKDVRMEPQGDKPLIRRLPLAPGARPEPLADAGSRRPAPLAIAALLFGVIFVLRLVVSDPDQPIALLYTVPVLIVAFEAGLFAGIGAALLAIGLGVFWDIGLMDADSAQTGEDYLIRTVLILIIGATVGGLAQRLRSSTEAQARLWEISADLLATADADGYFRRVSPAWEREFGWTAEQFTSRPFVDFVHPDDRERTTEELRRLIQSGGSQNFENRYMRSDGSYRTVQWMATVDPESGLVFAIARDVTAHAEADRRLQQAVEEANRANQAKSEFLSRMSHELRTPLNAILGFAQLLELAQLDPRHREAVAQIRQGGAHLLELVDGLLEISVIESGKTALALEPVSVAAAIEEALDLIEPLAGEAEVEVRAERLPLASVTVLADRRRLKQVLINLLSNAVKYNRAGGGVTVDCGPAVDGASIEIVVADDGRGMDSEQLASAFSSFERLGAERSGIEGTGLGLPLSRHLVELMGGTLRADSVPGRGTSMTVTLAPAGRAEPGTPDPAPEPRPEALALNGSTPTDQPTVVYVEDNEASVRLMDRVLETIDGVRLVSASTGERGLELAGEVAPSMVLLDVNLPDLSGAEILERLKGDPATADVPVVMISADATAGQAERLRAGGALDYLTKPIDVDWLRRLVVDCCRPNAAEPAPPL